MADGIEGSGRLEDLLAATEAEAERAVGVTKRLASAAAAARKAAATGDLRGLRRSFAAAEEALADAAEAIGQLGESWPLSEDEEAQLLASGAFTAELMEQARVAGLAIFEQDGVITTYPSLVRVLPRQGAVSIDRKPHRQIRPSRLAAHLKRLQDREPSLNPERFAEMLFAAYRILAPEPGAMVRLSDVHRALTLLPGSAREYGLQEFARDVYLLDRSGRTTTRSGARLRISTGATAARERRNLLSVMTRDGVEKTYYGIEFSEAEAGGAR